MVDGEHWCTFRIPRMVDNGVIFNPWQCWLTNRQQEGLNKVDDGCQKLKLYFFASLPPHNQLHVLLFSNTLRITKSLLCNIVTLSSIVSLVFSSAQRIAIVFVANIGLLQFTSFGLKFLNVNCLQKYAVNVNCIEKYAVRGLFEDDLQIQNSVTHYLALTSWSARMMMMVRIMMMIGKMVMIMIFVTMV